MPCDMDQTTRGVVIGLGSLIAICGAVLYWVPDKSAAPLDFIERDLGFIPDDGDGSIEILLITALGIIIAVGAYRWPHK